MLLSCASVLIFIFFKSDSIFFKSLLPFDAIMTFRFDSTLSGRFSSNIRNLRFFDRVQPFHRFLGVILRIRFFFLLLLLFFFSFNAFFLSFSIFLISARFFAAASSSCRQASASSFFCRFTFIFKLRKVFV